MIIDFQHHYTAPELMERGAGDGSLRLDENLNPNYRFNPLLADLPPQVQASVILSRRVCIEVQRVCGIRRLTKSSRAASVGDSTGTHRSRPKPISSSLEFGRHSRQWLRA